ncbi:glycoside hydrolase family protein [Paenirhodobacter populi]|uniref:Lysozyme n=1 Tax=Paenirhodobacter populi TaxID=2306993 RepID=A0A443J0A0_9RHOB|nr:glycoside hydrolase family protein [Sinirhodobacter populi]RWR13816.1 lysozyme [Sinirhodobacter populi]
MNEHLKISDRGLVALMIHEGIVPGPYLDSVGVWTYGVGHTRAAGLPDPKYMPRGMPADMDAELSEVGALFRKDIEKYAADVRKAVKVSLAQHEFDALVSFHYNTGAIARATLVKTLNAGDRAGAGRQFMSWVKPVEITGRRKSEQALFLNGTYPTGNINVWQVNGSGRITWKAARVLTSAQALALVGTASAETAPDTGPIGMGSKGPRVSQLQELLKDLGLYAIRVDGHWGQGTENAVATLRSKATEAEKIINPEAVR